MADGFKPCSVDGCNRNARKSAGGLRGLCASHYYRWRRHGDPTKGGPLRMKNRGLLCSAPGCKMEAKTKGMCKEHYSRFRTQGKFERSNVSKAGYESCRVDGCDGNPRQRNTAHGYCYKHYQRWKRHGDPLGGRTEDGSLLAWLEAHVDYAGDECLKWPYTTSKSGYGMVTFRGGRTNASRAMCILAHGEPPTDRHEAAHLCGKGHEACVNPRHLSWKTPAENHFDKVSHGTTNRGSRMPTSCLTEDDVRYIRKSAGTITQKDLAVKFRVDPSHINKIIRRKVWKWLE